MLNVSVKVIEIQLILNQHFFSSVAEAVAAVLPGLGMAHPSDVLDMPVDPNEPTYCLCHQVSYGEMIGCDNVDVSILINIDKQVVTCFYVNATR